MISVRGIAPVVAALALLGAGSASALSAVSTSTPAPSAAAPISPWLALSALSHRVETPERLCYWDFRDERWIPANSEHSAELINQDPRPVFREADSGLNRCQGDIPVAAIGTLGAVLSAFVYIAAEDKDGSFQRESISPS